LCMAAFYKRPKVNRIIDNGVSVSSYAAYPRKQFSSLSNLTNKIGLDASGSTRHNQHRQGVLPGIDWQIYNPSNSTLGGLKASNKRRINSQSFRGTRPSVFCQLPHRRASFHRSSMQHELWVVDWVYGSRVV